MMITPYTSQQPSTDFSLRFSKLKFSATLAATTDTTLVVPGDAKRYKAVIKVEQDGVVWVANNEVAAAPAGATFAATTSELVTDDRTLCREVVAGDTLHFFSTVGSVDVSVVFYAVGTNN